MQDPLLPPLAAIATGILASRFVSFEIREVFIVIAAFAILCAIALWRHARVLAGACCLLGLTFAGGVARPAVGPGDAAGGVCHSPAPSSIWRIARVPVRSWMPRGASP